MYKNNAMGFQNEKCSYKGKFSKWTILKKPKLDQIVLPTQSI